MRFDSVSMILVIAVAEPLHVRHCSPIKRRLPSRSERGSGLTAMFARFAPPLDSLGSVLLSIPGVNRVNACVAHDVS